MNPPPPPVMQLLVHRPGRLPAIIATAILVLGGVSVLALQVRTDLGRGWWTLVLLLPVAVGFAAIMRTGTTRCEVELGPAELVVRSVDSSQLLGRQREVSYSWDEVRTIRWMGPDGRQLRLNFHAAPTALVFTGTRKNLEALATAASPTDRSA